MYFGYITEMTSYIRFNVNQFFRSHKFDFRFQYYRLRILEKSPSYIISFVQHNDRRSSVYNLFVYMFSFVYDKSLSGGIRIYFTALNVNRVSFKYINIYKARL